MLFLYLIFIASVLYFDISKNKIKKVELSLLIIKKFDYEFKYYSAKKNYPVFTGTLHF